MREMRLCYRCGRELEPFDGTRFDSSSGNSRWVCGPCVRLLVVHDLDKIEKERERWGGEEVRT